MEPNNLNAPLDKFGNKLYWLNIGSNSEISIRNLVERSLSFVGFKGKNIMG